MQCEMARSARKGRQLICRAKSVPEVSETRPHSTHRSKFYFPRFEDEEPAQRI